MTTPPVNKRPLTAREVADLFAVSAETVATWADAGKLPGFKTPSGRWRFHTAEIEAFRLSHQKEVAS